MKIKTDFVTNSSSSSFIVVWPIKIKTQDDVGKYIDRNDFIPMIFRDAVSQKVHPVGPQSLKLISLEIEEGCVIGLPDYYDSEKKICEREGISYSQLSENQLWRDLCWEETEIKRKEAARKMAKKFIKENKGKGYVYFFSYGDEDGGVFADLEHKNDWGGLPYIQISFH